MKKIRIILPLLLITLCYSHLHAVPSAENQILRTVKSPFDFQKNTVSQIEFITSNCGIFGWDSVNKRGGGFWPRGIKNQYIFGCGIWFGALKRVKNDNSLRKHIEITYNPDKATSWFIPGVKEDSVTIDNSFANKYRCYFSTDYNIFSGEPLVPGSAPNWPLWRTDSTNYYRMGTINNYFEPDTNKRTKSTKPMGPLFVSDEDIVSVFKDSDLKHFEGGDTIRNSGDYPIGLQIENRIYSWEKTSYRNMIVLTYLITNTSKDTLLSCWLGGIFDVDIATGANSQQGASNDHIKYYESDPSLNLSVAWTDGEYGESGRGFGYIGISLLESPAVNIGNYLRKDKYLFDIKEQIGLKSARSWTIQEDVKTTDKRYDFISTNIKDKDEGPGDRRLLLGTGPFNLLPGETAKVSYLIALEWAVRDDADGSDLDMQNLINSVIKGRELYYSKLQTNYPEEQQSQSEYIAISPNPATDFIEISVPESTHTLKGAVESFHILNIVGEEVYPDSRQAITDNLLRFDVSNLAPGIYFIHFSDKVAKFLKM